MHERIIHMRGSAAVSLFFDSRLPFFAIDYVILSLISLSKAISKQKLLKIGKYLSIRQKANSNIKKVVFLFELYV